ncbi:VWFA domain-containing protein [Entamoeba marina]
MIYYGTVISEKDLDLVENIDFEIETCGINAKVKAIHHVCNPTDEPLNATITTTFDDETSVIGFSMESDILITSELKKIEEAKQDQADATSGGYSSSVMEKTDDTTFSLSLGLLKPHKVVKVTIEYLTKLQTSENMLIVKLPAPIQKKIPFSINLTGTTTFKFKGELTGEEEIEIEDKAEGIIVMKDEDTDEIIASSTFVNHEEEGDIEVIFVCDRSGSMGGSGIEALRETLQLFLRQLPLGCKFNIISFGSRFDSMFSNVVEYNDKILKEASKEVESFGSNYGGTNMYGPLEQAMQQKCHIIALTDGSLSDKTQVLELCKQNKENVVHSVGLGSSVDIQTVRDMARLTGGISVVSKNPKDLKSAISRITQRILTPTLNDININWSMKGELYPKNIAKMNNDLSVFLSLNDVKDVEQLKSLSCTLNGSIGKKKLTISNAKPTITNGVLLHQLLAAQKIKEAETNKDVETAVKLSLRYNVLSRHTAFIAVDKTTKQEVSDIKVVKIEDVFQNKFGLRFNRIPSRKQAQMCINDAIHVLPKVSIETGEKMRKREEKCFEVEEEKKQKEYEIQRMIEERKRCEEERCKVERHARERGISEEETCKMEMHAKEQEKREEEKRCMKRNRRCQEQKCTLSIHDKALDSTICSFDSTSPCLNDLIKLQNANGSFDNLNVIYPSVNDIIKKYPSVDVVVIHTFFAIQVFCIVFADKKVEWKLLVKKAQKFLSNAVLSDEIKDDITSLVKSL